MRAPWQFFRQGKYGMLRDWCAVEFRESTLVYQGRFQEAFITCLGLDDPPCWYACVQPLQKNGIFIAYKTQWEAMACVEDHVRRNL